MRAHVWPLLATTLVGLSSADAAKPLPVLNVDPKAVMVAGLGHAGDFAHQMQIAFSSMVSGACIFAGQPFNCAVSHFHQDEVVPKTGTAGSRVPNCNGCPPLTTLPFDHCKKTPEVVDIGSLVDYPRRHCGQNPISIYECFDDVNYVKPSRAFLFRGLNDTECAAGSIENTVGLLAQMISDPQASIKYVNDKPYGHVLPLKRDGYDGPGECLRHVFDVSDLANGAANAENWMVFDQTELAAPGIGFQPQGWAYIPEACKKSSRDYERPAANPPCKLIVRPDACNPQNKSMAADVEEFANYAEANNMVVLHPCVGGAVNTTSFPNSPDVAAGKLDVYGQLDPNYVQQSAPHMRAVGNMIKRVLGPAYTPPNTTAVSSSSLGLSASSRASTVTPASTDTALESGGIFTKLPTLNIDKQYVMTAGCSNTADFSHQFHVAFSSMVTGSCIFSGMPYHCAVTVFPNDYMVPKVDSTAAGIHCPNCTQDGTLIYDHCKNHPKWVDLDMLWSYAETADNVDDPKVHLADARVFAFGPTHDRCYQPPAMENVANFHLRYAKNKEQVKLIEDQPFPHTLPTNGTPYFNNASNTTGAGYDGPGECLKHVFGKGERLWCADSVDKSWWKRINVSEFVTDLGIGMKIGAWLFVPPQCKNMTSPNKCKLLIRPGGCDALVDPDPPGGSDDDFAKYGAVNGIVILKPCQGGPIDSKRFPLNHENLRGMVDVYGQLSADYATQKGDQMEPIGNMVKRLLGMDKA